MGWEASPLETQAVKDGIAAFEEQNPDITVSYTPGLAGAEYNAKILSSAAAGALPDVMFIASESYREVVSKGALMDITDNFNEEFPFDDFIYSSRSILEFDGRVYGVYGLESVSDTLNAQILSNGGTRYSDDYMESTINSPESKEVLETIKALREEDGSAPDASTLDAVGMSAKQMLQTGKVAMLVDGSWSLQELAASGMNIGMAPLPSYGKVLTTGQSHLHAISATTEHPEEAWKFLQFLSGMDYQGALCKSGLWMPNKISMYEGEQLEGWYDEKVHGDSYREMLTYFKDAVADPNAFQKSAQARDIVIEETDMYFKQGQDVDVTLQNIDRRINEAIKSATGQ